MDSAGRRDTDVEHSSDCLLTSTRAFKMRTCMHKGGLHVVNSFGKENGTGK